MPAAQADGFAREAAEQLREATANDLAQADAAHAQAHDALASTATRVGDALDGHRADVLGRLDGAAGGLTAALGDASGGLQTELAADRATALTLYNGAIVQATGSGWGALAQQQAEWRAQADQFAATASARADDQVARHGRLTDALPERLQAVSNDTVHERHRSWLGRRLSGLWSAFTHFAQGLLVAVVLIGLLVVIGVAIGATFTAALTAAVISLAASAFVVALLHRGASLVDAWGDWPWYQKVAGVFVAIGAAAGDVVGITGFVEGIFEEDIVTGRDLSPEEASERLWTGVFSLATAGLIHWFMRPAAAPTGEAPPGELGPGEPAPLELGPGEPVPLELGPGEPAPLQLGPGEPAPLQLGSGETPAEVAPGEAPPPELAPTESAPSDLGPVQTAPAEVSSTGAPPTETTTAQPPVPDRTSDPQQVGDQTVAKQRVAERPPVQSPSEFAVEAETRAGQLAHNDVSKAIGQHDFTGDTGARSAATDAYTEAFTKEYVQQREAGQPAQAASKAARKLASAEARRVGLERAIEVARQRGRADAESGRAFKDDADLDPATRAAKQNYENGTQGQTGKTLAPQLAGKSLAEITSILDAEAAAGHCVKSSPPLANGKPQLAYDFPDGTSVRVKPRGDTKTTDPMYSIEVLQHPGQRAMNQDGVAVKLGRDGTAVPKGPRDVKNPYKQKTRPKQFEAYLGEVMRQGHLRTTEPPTESP